MPRILVVEDSPTQARQLAFILQDAGFEVETAGDAEEGFALLGAAYDLVLTDLVLPGQSGFDLCRKIKASPALRRTPVVVITSQADPVNVLRGLEAGADGFMTKDREPAEIVGRLRRTLTALGPAASRDGAPPARVYFFDTQFELAVGREQLLNVLLSAFEDLVHANRKVQSSEAALRELNVKLQDIARSERQAHENLKKAQTQLVQAEKLSSLGQMVAGIAHEINNPLAFVINNVAVLQRDVKSLRDLLRLYQEAEGAPAERQAEALARIRSFAAGIDLTYTLSNLEELMLRSRDGLKRIQQIVKDLRDFARLDESDLSEVDLNAGINSTIHIIRSRAEDRRVEMALDLAPLTPVTCYPAKINQVVLNLVANAIDACGRGGRVAVSTRAVRGGVEIHVKDNGCGIDPTIRDKIFDPFFTTKPLGEGTGLGLSISYGIVQDHGGRIDVESTPGQGAHFTVYLPARPRRDAAGGG